MPKNQLNGLPFPPLVKIDTNAAIQPDKLAELLLSRLDGLSMCVRDAEGHQNRGGYFFHIKPTDSTLEACKIYNFEMSYVTSLPLVKLTAFVNHCAGLAFDEEAFKLCQSVVNFRLDAEQDI